MTNNDLLAFPYGRSTWILHQMTDDLTPAEWTHRATPGANHAAWIVGHLLVVERGALQALGVPVPPLPTEDFAARHGRGAKPGANDDGGDATKLMPLWDAQRNALVAAISVLPAADLERPIEHPMFKTLGQLLALMPVHTTLHAGQISTIRRSLGKPAAF